MLLYIRHESQKSFGGFFANGHDCLVDDNLKCHLLLGLVEPNFYNITQNTHKSILNHIISCDLHILNAEFKKF